MCGGIFMEQSLKQIHIYTDGACSGNPGPGGWGAILQFGENHKEISGFAGDTTNNRMEITAVIEALKSLKYSCDVKVYSDSAYVVNAFNQKWIVNWQKNSWKSKSGKVLNQDLWKELLEYTKIHKIEFIKVKGHSDNKYNNRCDELAVSEIKKRMK
jgi:ribonuclease HI